jgi:hypothetical protein
VVVVDGQETAWRRLDQFGIEALGSQNSRTEQTQKRAQLFMMMRISIDSTANYIRLWAVAESTGQYVFHARTYCPETPRVEERLRECMKVRNITPRSKIFLQLYQEAAESALEVTNEASRTRLYRYDRFIQENTFCVKNELQRSGNSKKSSSSLSGWDTTSVMGTT